MMINNKFAIVFGVVALLIFFTSVFGVVNGLNDPAYQKLVQDVATQRAIDEKQYYDEALRKSQTPTQEQAQILKPVTSTPTPTPIQITNWRIFVTQRNTEWGCKGMLYLEERVIFTKDQPLIATDGSVISLELPEIFWASLDRYAQFKVLDMWVNHVSKQQGPQVYVLTGCEVQVVRMEGYGVFVEK